MATTHEHMATTYHSAIQKLYIAYFNRPADYAGLNYWETVVEAANGNTAAVSAAFAASAEYKAEYGNKTPATVINQIYMNLFGRAAEPDGLAYWSDVVRSGAVTIDAAVTAIANGAQGTDKIAFDSKVAFASAFTAALDTPAEQAGYSGDLANDAAKEIVAGIKTAAQLAAAITPAALSASISAVVKAATPFTLASGLAALEAANEAKEEFLEEEETDEATIAAGVAAAEVALDVLVTGNYVASSDAVKAALLADEIALRADNLETAQDDYEAALEAAAEVEGLTDAIADLTAAETGLEALVDVQTEAQADVAAAIASYNVKNSVALTVNADGTVAGVIELDDDGELVLADDITEEDNPGVTALLAATIAKEAADMDVAAAEEAVAGAELIIDVLDLTMAGADELAAVGAAMTVVEPEDVDAPTGDEIIAEVAALTALAVAARAASDAAPADVALDAAADAAETDLADFQALVDAFAAADADVLVAAVDAAATAVEAAEDAVADLDEAVADLDEATELTAALEALNDAIDAAEEAFTDAGLKAPVALSAVNSATSGSDIFVAGDVMTSTVVNFGQLGTDSLFIGTDYVRNTTGDLTKGDNAKLEVFLVQSGSSVKVYLETEAYGSDAAAVAEQVITLTGITVAELTVANGIITAA